MSKDTSALYKGKYMLAFVTNDDLELIVALFDNPIEYALYENLDIDNVRPTIGKVLKGEITTMRLNGKQKAYKLVLIDAFEEDRHMKTFKEFRDEWLYAMGDMPTVVITKGDRKRHGLTKEGKATVCRTLNEPFFDRFDNYIVEDIQWKERVTVWLGNRQ